ncbi:Bsd2 protein [Candida orthopsilosis Co 90-125]|uniref:Bsd2 protein n=1 Tax=Candida orthopsilosis (strain 90-125) TaxID=1136231 RepID=H8X3R9_CANO9|nr:Bsd2 protein [Candida orthopsilosis Co 90-125]CCG25707.1 Bsd2 protein [Candida orthopsilosis Co 90-125]
MTAYERLSRNSEDREDSDDVSDSRCQQSTSNLLSQPSDNNTTTDTTTTPSPISSSSSSIPNQNDLESQAPPHLTPKQRIIRVLNHLLPVKQTYERLNNGLQTGRMQANRPGRFIGQGTDGVFQNLMAKPDTASAIEQQQRELHPPTYEEASQDNSPEYWESTMISPMFEDEVFVQGLPVGNIANFIWNALVTVAFQFIGFILCYLLHTSHAAKQGSRLGLGINLVMYGWDVLPTVLGNAKEVPQKIQVADPNDYEIEKSAKITGKVDNYIASGFFVQNSDNNGANSDGVVDGSEYGNTSAPYIAYGLISFGLFIIIKSIVDFYKVKQLERSILNPSLGGATNTTTTTTSTTATETQNAPGGTSRENNANDQAEQDPTDLR